MEPNENDTGGQAEAVPEEIPAEQLLLPGAAPAGETEEVRLRAMVEAAVYVTEEPLSVRQIAEALDAPPEKVKELLDELAAEYDKPSHGLAIREVAGGFKMGTKVEHHDAIRAFVKKLRPPLKLSMAALETLAVIAYKQPITAPEIMEIRGVQGAGVLKTLLERKLVTTAGRKNVVGRPMLYKTTRDFLIQFGLNSISELPTLKEFEELARLALSEPEPEAAAEAAGAPAAASEPGEAPDGVLPAEPMGPRSETAADEEAAPPGARTATEK
jgi:segregation and condensation protein B